MIFIYKYNSNSFLTHDNYKILPKFQGFQNAQIKLMYFQSIEGCVQTQYVIKFHLQNVAKQNPFTYLKSDKDQHTTNLYSLKNIHQYHPL